MARTLLVTKTLLDRDPASVAEEVADAKQSSFVHAKLGAIVGSAGAGIHGGESIVRVDSVSTTSGNGTVSTKSVLVTEVSSTNKAEGLTIGAVALKLTTTSANENSITFSTTNSPTQVATSLAATVNAHSKLSAVISAAASGARVTFTYLGAGIEGALITISEDSAALTLSGDTTFDPGGSFSKQLAAEKFGNFL